MLREASYPVAPRGLATSFTESEVPVQYAVKFRNRFINAAGGGEKRQGIAQLGDTITGTPALDAIHELIASDGTATMLLSGNGKIWKYSDSAGTSTLVHSGLDATSPLQSVQMGDRLIFVNGVDRNIYTKDGTTFKELKAIIETGTLSGAVSAGGSDDTDIGNWITDTDVVTNDVVHNLTLDAYGLITAVATANYTHTVIGSAGIGLGLASTDNAVNQIYEVIDTVALNVIPTSGEDDNVATLNSPSSATFVAVSAVSNWVATDTRVGDFISNTTRNALTAVTAISTAGLGVHGVTGQTNGDSITLLKSAMPISTRAHVHYGRLFLIDDRDQRKVRISGADDPQDFTSDAATLDSSTFSFGNIQPAGDAAVAMGSFLRYFVVAGKKNMYMFEGAVPVADVSALATETETRSAMDWTLVGIFPHGVVSPNAAISIGNDYAFVTRDGVQTISLAQSGTNLSRANISEAIKTTLRDLIKNTPESEISVTHYPKRSWFLVKIGTSIYCFNYTAYLGKDALIEGELSQGAGSWSFFDGKFAQQNAYFVRRDGTLVLAGAGGKVYRFDTNVYDDDGDNITTEYMSGWLSLSEPKVDVKTKQIHYIKPIVDCGNSSINYTIRAEAGFDAEATDTVTVSGAAGAGIGSAIIGSAVIGGTSIINQKYPLRVRGERVRIAINTDDQYGPDTISRYTLYFTDHGKR